jgi:cellulose synthase/poly-beta-1,6-N-acetylglucosamine synthase-like glycosyltransferase
MSSPTVIGLTEAILCSGAGVLSVPATLFGLECVLGSRKSAAPIKSQRPAGLRVGVLIPAHNEASGIATTLQSVMPQLQPDDRLLVIADNCTDLTASIARQCGAEVTERSHATQRGKGYALDHGLRHLLQGPKVDIVVMVDADCTLATDAMDHLIRACHETQGPVQGRYLMRAPAGSPIKLKVAQFAWMIKNRVRPRGMQAMGLPCHLTGAGMAFPTQDLAGVPLASGNLVEDMQLGLDLSRDGKAVAYCDEAVVYSEFPTSEQGLNSQRQRWEHGHLQTIFQQAPGLALAALKSRNVPLFGLALDLVIPPLTSLVMLMLVWFGLSALFAAWSGQTTALLVAMWSLTWVMAGVSLAWARGGKDILSARELMSIGQYMASKFPVYFSFLTRRQVSWVRTHRKEGSE